MQEASGSLHLVVWAFAVRLRWELNNTLFQPSPSLTKSLLSPHTFGFSFPVHSPSWKVFWLTISMIFWFSSSVPTGLGGFSSILICRFFPFVYYHLFQGFFSSIDLLSGFPPQSPVIGLGGFSPATWSFETHQLPYGARMFSLVSRFSSPVSQWVGRFFTKLHSYLHLHVRWSSCLRGKAIVMSDHGL